MSYRSLTQSIHSMLLRRVVAAALVLGLLFGALAFHNNEQRIEREVVELTRLRVSQFEFAILDLLEPSGVLTPEVLRERYDQFVAASGRSALRDGQFVFVRIYDLNDEILLDADDNEFSAVSAVRDAVDAAVIPDLAVDEFHVVSTTIDGLPLVGVATPLSNSGDESVGLIVGVFAVSAVAIDEIRGNILLTLLYVVGLILVTALTIYPIIARLLNRLSRQSIRLLDSNLEILQVLGSAIAMRDSDTDAHNYRVSVYSVCLAEAIDLPRDQIQGLIKGALLHDVGKIGIRDNILLKPGKLTDEEFAIMKTHVDHGLEITDRATWLKDAQPVVGGHHEKFDGAGYPAGLEGDVIPLAARIFAITDVFDALTSRRPYKDPMSFEKTMEILEAGSGSHFDPELLDAFRMIAKDLYASFAGADASLPKGRLEAMMDDYFKRYASDLLA